MQNDSSSANVSGEDVQAWIDGELSELEATRVKAAVAQDTELEALAASIRKQNDLIRSLHAISTSTAGATADKTNADQCASGLVDKAGVSLKSFAYAAALLVGVGIGWLGQDSLKGDTIEENWDREVLSVYDFLAEDSLWSVDFEADDLTTVRTATEHIIDRNLPVPDITEKQFSYYGAKILPTGDGTSIYFIYRDPNNRIVTIAFSSGNNLRQRFRPRIVNYDHMRLQVRQVGTYGVSIAAPLQDDTLDYVSAKVFSALR